MAMEAMTITMRTISLLGITIFGILLSLTFMSPKTVEESAKGFIKLQIEKEIRENQYLSSHTNISNKAQNITARLGFEKDRIQDDLDNKLAEKLASILASMCGYDCEKKQALARAITSSYLGRIKNIELAKNTLGDIVKGKYLEIVSNLKADLRIFLGANLFMFFLLLAVSLSRPKAIEHLFLPGLLLLTATILSSSIYIIGQDWLYTILYDDYMGFGYLAYIAVIFSVLIDIAFNKARVTTEIINGGCECYWFYIFGGFLLTAFNKQLAFAHAGLARLHFAHFSLRFTAPTTKSLCILFR